MKRNNSEMFVRYLPLTSALRLLVAMGAEHPHLKGERVINIILAPVEDQLVERIDAEKVVTANVLLPKHDSRLAGDAKGVVAVGGAAFTHLSDFGFHLVICPAVVTGNQAASPLAKMLKDFFAVLIYHSEIAAAISINMRRQHILPSGKKSLIDALVRIASIQNVADWAAGEVNFCEQRFFVGYRSS